MARVMEQFPDYGVNIVPLEDQDDLLVLALDFDENYAAGAAWWHMLHIYTQTMSFDFEKFHECYILPEK